MIVLLFVLMIFYDILKGMHVVFVATRKLISSLYQENEPSNQSLLEIYSPFFSRGRINKVLLTLSLEWLGYIYPPSIEGV